MTDHIKTPQDCITMAEVRNGVDDTDRKLVTLLESRFAYMRAAARIKTDRNAVRDELRKSVVIEAVRKQSIKVGLPSDELAAIWDALVETSIAYETREWDRLRAKK
ncbi:MAG: chorismate mutase [Pontixanthobacter sp.]